MPALEEITGPYEWLVRWDHITGTLQGQHYATATSILRDGVIVPGATSINPPQAITVESATTIAEVSELLNTGALQRIAELEAQLADALAQRDAVVARAEQAETAAQASA
ncbi:nucleotide exchange factor GrpE [Inquilinus limosus]|uniref:Uncharacterized protein n=1 Tax=Inquilinus limosus MP06 TaxID=1398085 RepID=A0A0A0DA57_9PROT|nr:hypothetical protein [Inquilinus limosus]KGM34768.1 hypothetical protein P409_08370 [Inquilinus limosus MP06]